jgi:GT2 family glycosyltransferase
LDTTVVLVNYNGGDYVLNCLAKLAGQTLAHHTLVIDNASKDNSLRAAVDAFPSVEALPLRSNTGFARAVNIAASRCRTPYLVLLNQDTEPAQDFLEALTQPLRDQPAIASVAGTLVFASRPDVVASAGIDVYQNGVALDSRLGRPIPPDTGLKPVFGASGGAMALRSEVFRAVGGFPEPFFMYLEDVDLAWRLRLGGWESVWAPAAVASHAYSAAAGEGSRFKRHLLARNRIWTLVRCLPDEWWRRWGRRIAGFDLAAAGYGLVSRDWPMSYGRLEAAARLAPRLCERRIIQRGRTVPLDELEHWLLPPISGKRLKELRETTARFATPVHPVR